jgi:hypothetical protein
MVIFNHNLKTNTMSEIKEKFRAACKEQLPKGSIVKTFLGVVNIEFFVSFNPEEWNFFPSLSVRNGDQRLWTYEYNPYFDEKNPAIRSKGSRMYYNGDGNVTDVDQAMTDAKAFLEELKTLINELTDLGELYDKWVELCKKHNFGK